VVLLVWVEGGAVCFGHGELGIVVEVVGELPEPPGVGFVVGCEWVVCAGDGGGDDGGFGGVAVAGCVFFYGFGGDDELVCSGVVDGESGDAAEFGGRGD
jgi:hypothetical protein